MIKKANTKYCFKNLQCICSEIQTIHKQTIINPDFKILLENKENMKKLT